MSVRRLEGREPPILCLVTDFRAWGHEAAGQRVDRREVLALVDAAARAGIDIVQVRERDWTGRDLLGLVANCVEIARETDTMIVVNERADVALAAGADGVHLRSSSFSAADLRRVVPQGFVIGRSVHGVDEVRAGAAVSTDYLLAGTVFPSRSKGLDAPVLGVAGLVRVVAASAVPVLAIGGVTTGTSAMVAASGGAGLAGIDVFGDAWRRERSLNSITERLRKGFASRGDCAATSPAPETTRPRRP